MGSQISALYYTLKSVIRDFNKLSLRISASPGTPVPNPSLSFWTVPNSPLARHGADAVLPPQFDILVIGSGITGTSVAKAILDKSSTIKLAMLEARDVCSGATGRNGGHICPDLHTEYSLLKISHGYEAALEILRFRLAHITLLLAVAEKENLLPTSQARKVSDYDVYFHPDLLRQAKSDLDEFLREAPKDLKESVELLEDREIIRALQLSSSAKGCIVREGAAIHPYRFVTGILSILLSRHSNFQLFTHTPCNEICVADGFYVVKTPRGEIRASHVVHATNGWSSHLLPGMRKKIIPFRAHMSAQRPGQGLAQIATSRAFVFYPSQHPLAFDYLTQLLPWSENSLPSRGEMMYGGGAVLGGASEDAVIENLGISDDSDTGFQIEAYLAGSLQRYFGEHWGAEGIGAEDDVDNKWDKGRMKAVWSGIIGMSADTLPWVGRVPKIASGRSAPVRTANASETSPTLAPPGEWISAGYSGEGMVHAWLCGDAVANMILGDGDRTRKSTAGAAGFAQLPKAFLITEKRVKTVVFEDLMTRFMAE